MFLAHVLPYCHSQKSSVKTWTGFWSAPQKLLGWETFSSVFLSHDEYKEKWVEHQQLLFQVTPKKSCYPYCEVENKNIATKNFCNQVSYQAMLNAKYFLNCETRKCIMMLLLSFFALRWSEVHLKSDSSAWLYFTYDPLKTCENYFRLFLSQPAKPLPKIVPTSSTDCMCKYNPWVLFSLLRRKNSRVFRPP